MSKTLNADETNLLLIVPLRKGELKLIV
jgi:hypothetical protein